MLTAGRSPHQRGMALLMAIIVLVALTLGALALTRTVYTSTVIAGNLAFQRAAMAASDLGIEAAAKWLEDARDGINPAASVCGIALQCSLPPGGGYIAHRATDQGDATNWQAYWDNHLEAIAVTVPMDEQVAGGNRVRYAIQRMCMREGNASDVKTTECVVSPDDNKCNSSGDCGAKLPPLVYYRITVRVDGPRGTVHLTQAMASM